MHVFCQCTAVFQFHFANCPAICPPVANRTVDQANIVGDTAVAGANDVSQAGVEGVENIAASTGMINQVSYHGFSAPTASSSSVDS